MDMDILQTGRQQIPDRWSDKTERLPHWLGLPVIYLFEQSLAVVLLYKLLFC